MLDGHGHWLGRLEGATGSWKLCKGVEWDLFERLGGCRRILGEDIELGRHCERVGVGIGVVEMNKGLAACGQWQ